MKATSCFSSETEELIQDNIHESEEGVDSADLSARDNRSLIFHLLYAIEAYDYDISLAAIIENFNRGFNLAIPSSGPLSDMVQGVIDQRYTLDEKVKPLLINWRFERVGVCTRLILRLALWELIYTQTEGRIIINEAIELAKCFAEKDAYKFINGILDEVAKQLSRLVIYKSTVSAAEE